MNLRHIAAVSIVAIFAMFTITSAQARHHHRIHHHRSFDAGCRNGTIQVNTAYDIRICVDPRFASKFQSFFTALKASGCHVTEIVCQAYGHAPGSNHIGGGACDVNQRARNRTIACMYHADGMIRQAGLFSGCDFRDCGHIEAMKGLGNYGGRHYASRRHGTRTYAARHRTTVHLAYQEIPH